MWKYRILIVMLLLASGAAAWAWWQGEKQRKIDMAAAEAELESLGARKLEVESQLAGLLAAPPKTVTVTRVVEGPIRYRDREVVRTLPAPPPPPTLRAWERLDVWNEAVEAGRAGLFLPVDEGDLFGSCRYEEFADPEGKPWGRIFWKGGVRQIDATTEKAVEVVRGPEQVEELEIAAVARGEVRKTRWASLIGGLRFPEGDVEARATLSTRRWLIALRGRSQAMDTPFLTFREQNESSTPFVGLRENTQIRWELSAEWVWRGQDHGPFVAVERQGADYAGLIGYGIRRGRW